MKKSEYKDFIDPEEFAGLYEEWAGAGKPKGNSPLYFNIWKDVENAVKACIGALQTRYQCEFQDYDDKVMEGTTTMIAKLIKMEETPLNIVTMSYLPMLGICCGPKAIQQDFERTFMSTSETTNGGDMFEDLLFMDENGDIQVGSWE